MSASQTFNKDDSSRLVIVIYGAKEDCPCHVYFGLLKNRLNDATAVYGPHETLYNLFKRWSEKSVFECIFKELTKPQNDVENVLMIDVTHLRTHRKAFSLKRGRQQAVLLSSIFHLA